MTKTVLSFGGGLQTTALAIMVAEGQLNVDEVIFADTGVEKPETYWYIENYIEPMLKGLPFTKVRNKETLYEYCWRRSVIPSVQHRWCTDHFKLRPILKHYKKQEVQMMIGFSADEINRSEGESQVERLFPLIERNIDTAGCVRIIQEYGIPVPLRSACYFCVFQLLPQWNWLKQHHPALIESSIALERNYYDNKPYVNKNYGLLRGTPLHKWGEGVQTEMLFAGEMSCWSGHCGR